MLFSFQERKMRPFKTENCEFLTFSRDIFTKAVFPKVYFHIQQEIGVMFPDGKAKFLITYFANEQTCTAELIWNL